MKHILILLTVLGLIACSTNDELPDIGADGLSVLTGKIPGSWPSGYQPPFQVLAGNELTNLMVWTIE